MKSRHRTPEGAPTEVARTLLRAAKLRATDQRIALLQQLRASHAPCSAESLHASLTDQMDLVTTYRNLEQFTARGLARRIDLGANHALYESAESHHHHVICESCGAVADIDACIPESLLARVQKKSGFAKLRDHSLEFFGTCSACARKGN